MSYQPDEGYDDHAELSAIDTESRELIDSVENIFNEIDLFERLNRPGGLELAK